MSLAELCPRFRKLFTGLDVAYGTGEGRWVKQPPRPEQYLYHLEGKGAGLGIAPLMQDGTVNFAAIDLDAPDFDLAQEFQRWIPGESWVERSRSGNAHVWVFFSEPCEAWVATGILKYAIESAGAKQVEVFPKQTSFDRVRLGNYINLPYHGSDRPILWDGADPTSGLELSDWLGRAESTLNSPKDWRKRAGWLMIENPADRKPDRGPSKFGSKTTLHICAEHVIEGALSGERPILQGHRSVVYFNLAKQLANCSMWSEAETLDVLLQVREASDVHNTTDKPEAELRRYVRNAYEKQYTSTGCDDPVFGPYAHPDCPIANPRR